MAVRITCINKAHGDHENPYVAISELGWVNEATGQTGKSTRDSMYEFVAHQDGEAYVVGGATRARVIAVISPHGTRYVRTQPDGTKQDNLLKLLECR